MTPIKKRFKQLKQMLFSLVLMQVIFTVFLFLNIDENALEQSENFKAIVPHYTLLCFLYFGYMIWFIWNKIPINKNRKHILTLQVLLLNIIGIPFWNTDEE